MTSEQISLTAWSFDQQVAAEYLAAGYSQLRTSQLARGEDGKFIGLRSINRWWSEPAYRDYVDAIRERIAAAQKPLFQSTIAIAQELLLKALTGEVEPDDPRVRLAERVCERTIHRLAGVDARFTDATPALPAAGSGPARLTA